MDFNKRTRINRLPRAKARGFFVPAGLRVSPMQENVGETRNIQIGMLVRLLFLVHRSVNGCVSSDFQGRSAASRSRPADFLWQRREVDVFADKKILVVDDQYGIRVLLKEVFSKDDFCVYQAENGQVALDLIQKIRPDLILLDMKMPGMDGIEFLRRLQDIPPMPKVIMMTAYGELDMVQEATKLGALAHLTKPFDIVELRSEVLKQLAS